MQRRRRCLSRCVSADRTVPRGMLGMTRISGFSLASAAAPLHSSSSFRVAERSVTSAYVRALLTGLARLGAAGNGLHTTGIERRDEDDFQDGPMRTMPSRDEVMKSKQTADDADPPASRGVICISAFCSTAAVAQSRVRSHECGPPHTTWPAPAFFAARSVCRESSRCEVGDDGGSGASGYASEVEVSQDRSRSNVSLRPRERLRARAPSRQPQPPASLETIGAVCALTSSRSLCTCARRVWPRA